MIEKNFVDVRLKAYNTDKIFFRKFEVKLKVLVQRVNINNYKLTLPSSSEILLFTIFLPRTLQSVSPNHEQHKTP